MQKALYKIKTELKKLKTLYQAFLKAYSVYCSLKRNIIKWSEKIDRDRKSDSLKYVIKAIKCIIIIPRNLLKSFIFLVLIPFSKKKPSAVIYDKTYIEDVWFVEHIQSALLRICSSVFISYHVFINYFKKKPDKASSILHVSIITTKAYMLSRLLRKHGLKSDFLAMNADIADRINIGYDYHIPYNIHIRDRRWIEFYYLWSVLARYDVIHFHFNTLLSIDNGWEISYLKRLNKVLVFHFRGCDLRQKSMNMAISPDLNCCMGCDYMEGSCDTDYQRNRIAKARSNGDLFFVTTPDLQDFFPEAEHIPFISPYGIDFDNIKPVGKKAGVFRVVTSSNHPGLDGVPYVREAVSRLSEEGFNIELLEVIQLPFFEALSIYKSADLFAGKLTMGYYNNANIETMMMGVPNMSYIRKEYLHKIPDCPIINSRPDNIYENIKEWIQKPEELKEIGAKGPSFVKKYHDPDVIIDRMIRKYNEAVLNKSSDKGH